MSRYRAVKKYGNSWVIALSIKDMEDLNLKEGDLIDIEDAVVNKSIPEELNNETK